MLFQKFDENGDGVITKKEMSTFIIKVFQLPDMKDSQTQESNIFADKILKKEILPKKIINNNE